MRLVLNNLNLFLEIALLACLAVYNYNNYSQVEVCLRSNYYFTERPSFRLLRKAFVLVVQSSRGISGIITRIIC